MISFCKGNQRFSTGAFCLFLSLELTLLRPLGFLKGVFQDFSPTFDRINYTANNRPNTAVFSAFFALSERKSVNSRDYNSIFLATGGGEVFLQKQMRKHTAQ